MQRLAVASGGAEGEERELETLRSALSQKRAQWDEERAQLELELRQRTAESQADLERVHNDAAAAAKALRDFKQKSSEMRSELEANIAKALRRDLSTREAAKHEAKVASGELFDAQEAWFTEKSALERQLADAQRAAATAEVRSGHTPHAHVTKCPPHRTEMNGLLSVYLVARRINARYVVWSVSCHAEATE